MTTAAAERNGASDVSRARENPPSRKPAEHYWGILAFSCEPVKLENRSVGPGITATDEEGAGADADNGAGSGPGCLLPCGPLV